MISRAPTNTDTPRTSTTLRPPPLSPARLPLRSFRSACPIRAEAFDLVDRKLLIPPDLPIRGGSRTDAGVVLDRELTRLAAADARCRLVRASIAARLIATRAWRALGFVRLSDFARERLGISPRSLEEDALVLGRLAALPHLRAALESGDLSWTRARLLVRVATTTNEILLLEESRPIPMRDLDEWVRNIAAAATASSHAPEAAQTTPLRATTSAGEADLHASTAASPVVHSTTASPFLSALAARVSAAPDGNAASTLGTAARSAPDGNAAPGHDAHRDVATSIDANPREATPDTDDPLVRWSIDLSRSGRRLWRTACEYASRSAGSALSPAQVLELVIAEAASSLPPSSIAPWDTASPDPAHSDIAPSTASPSSAASSSAASPGIASFGRAPSDAASSELASSSAAPPHQSSPDATPTTAPDHSAPAWVPPREVHEQRLRLAIHAREARGRRTLLGFLAECGVAEGFPWLAPASRDPGPAAAVAALQEGLEFADAFELERRLQQLRILTQRLEGQMAALLRTGVDRQLFREIGFASVKLYAEARLGISARRVWSLVAIERESWRRSRQLHTAWKEGRITSLQATALLPVLSERHAEAWIARAGEVTLRRLQDEVAWALDHGQEPPYRGEDAPPPPLDADLRADGLADVTRDEVQKRAHDPAPHSSFGAPGAVRCDFFLPLSVAVLLEETLDRLQRHHEGRWHAFERMIALALLEWTATPRHPDPVFERDGWRCAVPGCSSRRNLHDHHVVFRSRGGGNQQANRITVCAAHHLHGIHQGIVRVEGVAPHALHWELGCAGGMPPLMRLVGDRLVGDAIIAG